MTGSADATPGFDGQQEALAEAEPAETTAAVQPGPPADPAAGSAEPEQPAAPSPKPAAPLDADEDEEEEDDTSAVGVLANHDFLILWLSQLATQIGGNTVLYGLTVMVYAASNQSTSAVGLLLLSFLAPAVLFGTLAGVFVDRFDRRNVLVATSLSRGAVFVVTAGLGFIVLQNSGPGQLSPGWIVPAILGLNILISISTTFFAPAELAMIPLLVRREQLTAANGIFTLTLNAAFAVGYTLMGPLLTKVANPAVLILIVAGLYFVSAALCRKLPPAPASTKQHAGMHEAEAAFGSVFTQLREGLAYVRSNHNAGWALTYLATAAAIVGVLGALGPGFATNVMHLKPDDFVVVVLPLGFGVVFGALLVNAIRDVIPRRRLIEIGLLTIGVCLAMISIAGPISDFLLKLSKAQPVFDASSIISVVAVVIAIATVAGVAYAAIAIPAQTELQEEIPTEVRGRVFGMLNTLVSVSSFLPIIIGATVSDIFGVAPVLLATAILVFAVGAASVAARRPVRLRRSLRRALRSVRFELQEAGLMVTRQKPPDQPAGHESGDDRGAPDEPGPVAEES